MNKIKHVVKECDEFIQSRIEKFEKDTGIKFSDEFKCGFYAGVADIMAYAQELGEEKNE